MIVQQEQLQLSKKTIVIQRRRCCKTYIFTVIYTKVRNRLKVRDTRAQRLFRHYFREIRCLHKWYWSLALQSLSPNGSVDKTYTKCTRYVTTWHVSKPALSRSHLQDTQLTATVYTAICRCKYGRKLFLSKKKKNSRVCDSGIRVSRYFKSIILYNIIMASISISTHSLCPLRTSSWACSRKWKSNPPLEPRFPRRSRRTD